MLDLGVAERLRQCERCLASIVQSRIVCPPFEKEPDQRYIMITYGYMKEAITCVGWVAVDQFWISVEHHSYRGIVAALAGVEES